MKDLQGNSGCALLIVAVGVWIIAAARWGWSGVGGGLIAIGAAVIIVNYVADLLETRRR